jgi:hypothetical protein
MALGRREPANFGSSVWLGLGGAGESDSEPGQHSAALAFSFARAGRTERETKAGRFFGCGVRPGFALRRAA